MKTPNEIVAFYFDSPEFNADIWYKERRVQGLMDIEVPIREVLEIMESEQEVRIFNEKRLDTCLSALKSYLIEKGMQDSLLRQEANTELREQTYSARFKQLDEQLEKVKNDFIKILKDIVSKL